MVGRGDDAVARRPRGLVGGRVRVGAGVHRVMPEHRRAFNLEGREDNLLAKDKEDHCQLRRGNELTSEPGAEALAKAAGPRGWKGSGGQPAFAKGFGVAA